MGESGSSGPWGAEQRLEFIEFRLFWDGSLSRSDITGKFGVSVPQASLDIAKYRKAAPQNIDYNASRKRYIANRKFTPVFYKPNVERYLAQLNAIGGNVISVDDTMFGNIPSSDGVPTPARNISSDMLRTLLTAIREQNAISIKYQSMNKKRPEAIWRDISPQGLATDGMRWHIRGYCHIDKIYKDFIISRCVKVGKIFDYLEEIVPDTEWDSYFDIVLVPNPKLTVHQRTVIARDYGMRNNALKVRVRRALLYYFDRRHRFDIPDEKLAPEQAPIVVLNRKEYDQALSRMETLGFSSSII